MSVKGILYNREELFRSSTSLLDHPGWCRGKWKALRTERGELILAEVVIQDGETLESALRRFKRKVQQEDIIKDIKRHSYYMKPGEKRRTKQALARKRSRKRRSREIE